MFAYEIGTDAGEGASTTPLSVKVQGLGFRFQGLGLGVRGLGLGAEGLGLRV